MVVRALLTRAGLFLSNLVVGVADIVVLSVIRFSLAGCDWLSGVYCYVLSIYSSVISRATTSLYRVQAKLKKGANYTNIN